MLSASCQRKGRPPNLERRREILRAAGDALAHTGVEGTSLRDIARSASISPSLLQRYFPTKQALIHACVEDGIDQLDGVLAEVRTIAHRHRDDPKAMLLSMGASYVAFLEQARGLYTIWMLTPANIEPYAEHLPDLIASVHRQAAAVLAADGAYTIEEASCAIESFHGALLAHVLFYERIGYRDPLDGDTTARIELLSAMVSGRRTS